MPNPFAFALGAQVAYVPDITPHTPHPSPWRVVGRFLVQQCDLPDFIQYKIEPWTLSGTWSIDAPLRVRENQVQLWVPCGTSEEDDG